MSKRIFKGVNYQASRDRWQARIMFNGKKYCKYFKTESEALEWYEEMSLKLYGMDRIHEPVLVKESK